MRIMKYKRMNNIKKNLKEKPMIFQDIFESLKKAKLITGNNTDKRSVQNYLAELNALEITTYDPSSGFYKSAENEKQVFESKHDYQIALTHSKNLLFSNSKDNTQRFDRINPNLAVDLLVYESERDADDFAIWQHLKTGCPEIFEDLLKYRELMDETGLSKRSCLPKLDGRTYSNENTEQRIEFDDGLPKRPSHEPFPSFLPNTIDDKPIDFTSGTLGLNKIIARVPASKVEEILNLRDSIVRKIYGHIMNSVRNGTPLKGNCDFCPNKEVIIKEK